MDTFLRLAGLGTLIVGLQLVAPESSSASTIAPHFKNFTTTEKSTVVLPIDRNYDPPNNGGPSSGGSQGSGTR
ncbi:hypothetical protein ACE1B6_23710 [Aerosakkonemataceae cyanobacterium BLCC-F154]|uniref:Uncharacterized protein n=1 Tax=Floridaenema fluviatile BLCC-F154 TaxID=3153640 RepID=A0ABV4YJA0_9CYAN